MAMNKLPLFENFNVSIPVNAIDYDLKDINKKKKALDYYKKLSDHREFNKLIDHCINEFNTDGRRNPNGHKLSVDSIANNTIKVKYDDELDISFKVTGLPDSFYYENDDFMSPGDECQMGLTIEDGKCTINLY